jgi:hypothetical protein
MKNMARSGFDAQLGQADQFPAAAVVVRKRTAGLNVSSVGIVSVVPAC